MMVPSGCAVRVIDLPHSVGAMVAFDEDGYASVYLNARWPFECQRKALQHELRHIAHNDAFNARDIQSIERDEEGN